MKSRTKHVPQTFSIKNKDEGKKGSCSVCYKEFEVPDESSKGFTDEEIEESKTGDGMMSHLKCLEYKDMKADREEAIDNGTKRKCPECGVGGVKDDAGTHMTGDNCQTKWCYFCSKALKDLDLDGKEHDDPIYGHNTDWNINTKRGPMFLSEISQIDKRYSSLDEEAKTFFHKLLTYTNIKEFFQKYSDDEFEELCDVFPSVKNHGYDLEEAMTIDLTLIKR